MLTANDEKYKKKCIRSFKKKHLDQLGNLLTIRHMSFLPFSRGKEWEAKGYNIRTELFYLISLSF